MPGNRSFYMDHSKIRENKEEAKGKVGRWRRLGAGSLMISVVFHSIILMVAVIWVLRIIPDEPEKIVEFSSSRGGGEPRQASAGAHQRKVANHMAKRVSAIGVSSNFSLPDPDKSQIVALAPMGSLGSGALGAGGKGDGKGGSNGPGGIGSGPGLGMGPPTKVNPFGGLNLTGNALVGVLYDLKQDAERKATNVTTEETPKIIRDFISQGWKEESLKGKFFKAPQKLSQTKIYIPPIRADAAPAAFQCEKDVAPSRWMVIYKGTVTPPRSGTYRFVGAGDDVLVVRFNRQNVLDHGWVSGTSGMSISRNLGVLSGRSKDREIEKSFRGYPMNFPVTYYQYEGTEEWNRAIGGLAVGRKFEAKAGQSYPIEILICEIPGGSFGACLLMEREGEKYEKSPTGAPILPLFSLDHTGASSAEANGPPFTDESPRWKVVQGKLGLD